MSTERRQNITSEGAAGRLRLELATEGVILIDRLGQAAYADDAVYRILGHEPDSARPTAAALVDRIQLAGGHSFADALQEAFDSGAWEGEAAGLTALNHAILLHVAIRRVQDEGGQRLGAILVARDVTRAQAVLHQIFESPRLELIEKFNRGIGHEFKNLLTIIMAYGALLSKSLEGDEFQEEIRHIIDTAEQANDLINLMGVLVRPQPQHAEETDLNTAMDNVRRFLSKGLPINVSFSMPDHVSLPAVHVNPVELQKVLLHLALNAAEAMPGGGRISIDVEGTNVSGEDLLHVPVRRAGRYVVISVSDHGTGFSEEARRRMFEPFFTTKEKGTGLGLSSAWYAVEAMHGVMRIYNEPGKGAGVRVYLPVSEESARSFTDLEGLDAGADSAGAGRVLVIDDDEATRNLARTMLRKAGYQVTTSSSGAEGIAAFKRRQGEIDAVLLDVVMPNLGGKETLQRLRDLRADLPVVMMSGFSQRAVQEILGDADLPCIAKPFTREQLLRAVREALAPRTSA